MIQTGNLDIPRLHSPNTFSSLFHPKPDDENIIIYTERAESGLLGGQPSTTFHDRKQIFSSFSFISFLKRIFCWSSSLSAAFLFIFVRLYFFGLWKSTNVLSSKPDAGREMSWLYTQPNCHYQLWLILLAFDPFTIVNLSSWHFYAARLH